MRVSPARQLDGHVDLIHVSAGSHERDEVFTITHPSMFLEEGCNSIYAAEIKKMSHPKVVTVGASVTLSSWKKLARESRLCRYSLFSYRRSRSAQ